MRSYWFFQLVILASIIQLTWEQLNNSYSSFYNGRATAMDISYGSSITNHTVVFANGNRQLVHYNINTMTLINTISTTHKSDISTIAISPNRGFILSGGSDFTTRIYDLTTGSQICFFDELRGNIISSKIDPDNNFFAFASNQGYLYYGFISNCTKTNINRTLNSDYFYSLQIFQSRRQIWLANGKSQFLIYNIDFKTFVTNSLSTSKSIFLRNAPTVSFVGLCTSTAFYLLNSSGTVKMTINYPTLFNENCRIYQQNSLIFLVATTQRTSYTSDLGTIYPIWNVWKIDPSSMKAYLYHQQQNDLGSPRRYGSFSSIVQDAGIFQINSQVIQIVSIAIGFNPYRNIYRDGISSWNVGSPTCNKGFFATSPLSSCLKCSWDDTVRANCVQCDASGCGGTCSITCKDCGPYYYLASGTCSPCIANCYFCTSNSNCFQCIGGYTYVNSQCRISNISGCIKSFWNTSSSQLVSQCSICQIGYFYQNQTVCRSCGLYFANCSKCSRTQCFECNPNFILLSSTAPNNCQICSHAIQGCASCLNQSYCDTCYQWYQYFHNPSPGVRLCKRTCYWQCVTCLHLQYKTCNSCDSNRTLNGSNICICKPQFPINDSSTLLCQACRDYLINCDNCTSKTFCVTCDLTYFFQDINTTHQYCKKCNYTCKNCDTYWYKCLDCELNDFRILDTTTNRCICKSMAFFQMGNNSKCQMCFEHINHCQICFNQTYCITCDSGYFLKSNGPGIIICAQCQLPCTQCYGNATNCSDCATGRVLDSITRKCNCLDGYYPTGLVDCQPCSPVLGGCATCNNDTICLSCWPNNYFEMNGNKRQCHACQRTCLSCTNWTTSCGACDPLANRAYNNTTKQCDCIAGYVESAGSCLNCSGTFQYCISCNLTHCFACMPGYSLAYGGLKCVDCASTYPGCINCLNGVCAACNQTDGYQLSYSKCICKPGRYFKTLKCLPYAMGSSIQRLFEGYASYYQNMNTNQIIIKIYFRCQGIKLPYGIHNSVNLTINGAQIITYSVSQTNTTLVFKFTPKQEISKAVIRLQFFNKTLFDLEQYGPKNRVFQFNKNIFVDEKYLLSQSFSLFYQKYIISAVRWITSILILLGCADFIVILVFTTHILPAFLLLRLSPPIPLYNVLKSMIKINYQSLFVFANIDVKYEDYSKYNNLIQTYGISGGIVNRKIMDLVFLGCLLAFYGVICPRLTPYVPEGKIKRLWQIKFNLKRYSTLTNIVLCFLPSFQTCSIMDFRMQQFNPVSYFTIGIALLVLAFSCIYIFSHSIILYNTQFNDLFKNQDCYFGSSILEPRSITFILSLLLIGVITTPLLGLFSGLISLPILMLVTLAYLSHFRFWDNFPNKILFFIKLFYGLFFLFFLIAFLLFTISQKYSSMDIKSISLVGLIALVSILILFSLSCAQSLILILNTVYKNCKQSTTNLVDNLEQQKERRQQEQSESNEAESIHNMRIKIAQKARQEEMQNLKLTNKQEHMKMFRQQHLRTVGDQMYLRTTTKTQQSFRETGMSNPSKKRK